MTDEIEEAIEAACSSGSGRAEGGVGRPLRRVAPLTMREMVKEFLRNVPEDMSVRELLDKL